MTKIKMGSSFAVVNGTKKSVVPYFGSTFRLRITIDISILISDLEIN